MQTVASPSRFRRYELAVLLFAALTFFGGIASPPSLMDDVDSAQASIARTIVQTHDWVTLRLDGVKYFEKAPLKYWLIAVSFKLFGQHDWSARLPLILIDVLLCWLIFHIGAWAFGELAGFFAALALSTCIGLFLFTRILIPDSQLTFAITLALWSFARALDSGEPRPRAWVLGFWSSIAVAVLLKGLIGIIFPVAIAFLYLFLTRQLFVRETWRRLNPLWGILLLLVIAAPWHVLATIHNPPLLRFDLHSEPGQYRGFFWFYFINEHLLRFLSRRYPNDYDTVPRLSFWLLNLLWLFPWSVYLPATFKLSYRAPDRAARMRLLLLCAIGFVMMFFTFSSTQEYYSMPIYPAAALLLGCGLASKGVSEERWIERGSVLLGVVCSLALVVMVAILLRVWNLPSPGDISEALQQKTTSEYTLSLGHMGDLTLASFAYLRLPLMIAAAATLIGVAGVLFFKNSKRVLAVALMMVVFFHAARLAMVAFDPYLSSRPLADALLQAPPGKLIVSDQYYSFSSVLFYANTNAYLLNGRVQNLEYGSNAPDVPDVFIGDNDLARMWHAPQRYYLLAEHEFLPAIEKVIGPANFTVVRQSGGKYLITNHPLG
jgi:4-amino-4-deoxy-L-arabinose transferase-like glycosyltransferase